MMAGFLEEDVFEELWLQLLQAANNSNCNSELSPVCDIPKNYNTWNI